MTHVIETKYHGPSNTRGSRIIARTHAGSVTFGYDHALNADANHIEAARTLATKLGWSGAWVMGWNLAGTGAVFLKEGNGALVIDTPAPKGWDMAEGGAA